MAQSLASQAFQVLDDFISDENKANGTDLFRDKNGDDGPEDVVFTDSTMDNMAFSANLEDLDNDPLAVLFIYDSKYRDVVSRLEQRLLQNLNIKSQIEDWS